MEPVLGGRDDLGARAGTWSGYRSRNGARPWRTGRRHVITAVTLCRRSRNGARPWRTGRHVFATAYDRHLAAAMEPVLGGRDDCAGTTTPRAARRAAMEPVLGGRDDSACPQSGGLLAGAAMEPVLGGRDDWPSRWQSAVPLIRRNGARPWRTGRRTAAACAGTRTCRRNGARPWRTGRPPPPPPPPPKKKPPQWSPSLADGTTVRLRAAAAVRRAAAMEPVLGGRDDGPGGRPPTPSGRRRNGARPWRTGRPASCATWPRARTGRNGARPWRTGRPVIRFPAALHPGHAAMEPVLGGRDDRR